MIDISRKAINLLVQHFEGMLTTEQLIEKLSLLEPYEFLILREEAGEDSDLVKQVDEMKKSRAAGVDSKR